MQRINRGRWTHWTIGFAVVLFCGWAAFTWPSSRSVVLRPEIELLLDDISGEPTPDNIATLISKARAHRSAGTWGLDGSLDENNLAPNEVAHVARHLRKQYPFENLTDRLAYERKANRPRFRLSQTASDWLSELESEQASYLHSKMFSPGFSTERAEALKKLHGDEVVAFINREGEGMARMPTYGVEFVVLPEIQSIPLANVDTAYVTQSDPHTHYHSYQNPKQTARTPFFELHASYRRDFAATRNGLVVDVDQVAGFVPHAITHREDIVSSEAPPNTQTTVDHSNAETQPIPLWRVANLQLVSLLKSDQPHVYVSEFMPAMTELPDLEMRDLTPFEDKSLKRLYAGEDIVSETTDDKIRMFGSLRASKDCRSCHSVGRGELLGAFSYELVRVTTPSDSNSTGSLALSTSVEHDGVR